MYWKENRAKVVHRDLSLDLARGFTVLFIPVIHFVMVFCAPETHNSWFGLFLRFIAEGPGAQLLMMLIGMFMVFKYSTLQQVLLRAAGLFIAGCLLNYLKFGILYQFNLLPAAVTGALQIENITDIITIGDILHFAAIAMVINGFIIRLKTYYLWAPVLAGIVIFTSPYCWDISDNYFMQLLGGQPPRVFFPVFPWLAYSLIGLSIGHYWLINARKTAGVCGVTGVAIIILCYVLKDLFYESSAAGFYRTYPLETLWHIGLVLLVLQLWKLLEELLPFNLFFALLCFCSRHISIIYFVQWIVICWLIPVLGYQELYF